ncbi:MAG: hypothetical protein JWP03_1853 [Phycisphaerales bacterium]|jgi:hypothetical protein|nr:hypothetical protein [Phycisphaerales bacterium]
MWDGAAGGEGKRVIRRLFTLLSAVSLLLSLAVVQMWVQSSRDPNYSVIFDIYGTDRRILISREGLSLAGPISASGWPPFISFSYAHGVTPYGAARSVSYPLAAVATAALPLAWSARRVWKWRRRSPGICTTCGYDLRATPERCPECGAMPQGEKVNA